LQTLLVQRGEADPALLHNNQIRGAGSDQNSSYDLSKTDQGRYLSEKRENEQINAPPNFREAQSA
jgi:hypothetical protein